MLPEPMLPQVEPGRSRPLAPVRAPRGFFNDRHFEVVLHEPVASDRTQEDKDGEYGG